MAKPEDLPPAYSTLKESSINVTNIKDTDPICGDGSGSELDDTFENKTIRLIFIQKVLIIKLLQLFAATLMMVFFAINTCSHIYIFEYLVHFFAVSTIAFIVTYGLLICCDESRRKNPYKYMFLVACPATFAFFICVLFVYLDSMPLFMTAWGNYCVAIFSLLVYSILAMNSELEFKTTYGILIAGGTQTVVYAITVPMCHMNAFYVLYPTLIMPLHIYVLSDIQAMTTKNYPASLTPDDFVDGAINIYIDYVYIYRIHVLPKLRQLWGKCMLCTEVGRASTVTLIKD